MSTPPFLVSEGLRFAPVQTTFPARSAGWVERHSMGDAELTWGAMFKYLLA